MKSSDTFRPVSNNIDYSANYSMPEEFYITGSAKLYRVRKSGKYFIIKTSKDNSGQSLAMLQREYELSIGKQHPNIVSIFTYEPLTVVGPGIVMEYIDGRTLTQFIAEKPTIKERKRVFKQLLDAVSYIHRSGLVHNDIKPDNIMITRSGNDVKLIDFGLADNDAYYLAHTLGCTPAYASPELLAREKNIDTRSDIYSLGAVMKELFGSKYSHITTKCLDKDKEKRYANVEELLKAIENNDTRKTAIVLLPIITALLLPIGYYLYSNTTELNKYRTEKQKEANIADKQELVCKKIENSVDSIYNIYSSIVSNEVYTEFACAHLGPYYKTMGDYQVENISSIEDTELYTKVADRYAQKYNKCLASLTKQIESLPSIYDYESGLSEEEIEYYRTLLFAKKPFTPYDKAHKPNTKELNKYRTEKQEEVNIINQQEVVYNNVENSVDSIYNLFSNIVSNEVYCEFACEQLDEYYKTMEEYFVENISSIKDYELLNKAVDRYTQRYNTRLYNLTKKIESLPSIYNSGLSEEEIEYYQTLIFNRKPFTPYNKNSN